MMRLSPTERLDDALSVVASLNRDQGQLRTRLEHQDLQLQALRDLVAAEGDMRLDHAVKAVVDERNKLRELARLQEEATDPMNGALAAIRRLVQRPNLPLVDAVREFATLPVSCDHCSKPAVCNQCDHHKPSRDGSTLQDLQVSLPWTIKYSRDFRSNPQPHKDFTHAIVHVGKALGKLFAFADDMDHDRDVALRPETLHRHRQYVADLVVCALRAANVYPGGPFDLHDAVVDRVRTKNAPAPEKD